ncbi:hypothetical protein [Actinomadura kijaniata]|uniref:hypothetical protein n=1 Tax=Actinomadura kijaniata TaxID=46161 RepID=UPI0008309257|nr:hypothetical protein [Actinomadura kijaniata]
MGVLFEYFRAADRGAALVLLGPDGDPPSAPSATTADALRAEGIDSTVMLGQLVALVREVPWDSDLVRVDLVWPESEPDAADAGDLAEDSPWNSGVTVEELDDGLRDDLAAVPDAELPALAGRWARIERTDELTDDADPEALAALLAQLVGLARRARDDGDHLYSWCSVEV